MKKIVFSAFVFVAVLIPGSTSAVTISTVPIGSPGNLADTRYDASGFGSVPYNYRIGKYEVTNGQYAEFLNAVAASDPYELYRPIMGDIWGGIIRDGVDGSYNYSIKAAAVGEGLNGGDYSYESKPVSFVSWFNALRFANWLHNGQGNGDTETGAYTLLGGTPVPSNWLTIARNPGARWFLPNEDEWYKSAYYDPLTDIYYDYPTGTNALPDNNSPLTDTGNSANRHPGVTGSTIYPLTDVGSYTLSGSPYGTFDQAGNVDEWTETYVRGGVVLRGGSWRIIANSMLASRRGGSDPTERNHVGFRLASIPEPSTMFLLALGTLALLFSRFNPATNWR